MATVYLLYYDTNESCSREEWNTFYTPVEVFIKDSLRQQRIKYIEGKRPDLEFHEVDVDVTEASDITSDFSNSI